MALQTGQKKSCPLEVESLAVWATMWVLRTEPGFSAGALSAVTAEPSPGACRFLLSSLLPQGPPTPLFLTSSNVDWLRVHTPLNLHASSQPSFSPLPTYWEHGVVKQAIKWPLHVTTLLCPHLTRTPLVEDYFKEAKMCYMCLCAAFA